MHTLFVYVCVSTVAVSSFDSHAPVPLPPTAYSYSPHSVAVSVVLSIAFRGVNKTLDLCARLARQQQKESASARREVLMALGNNYSVSPSSTFLISPVQSLSRRV